MTWQNPLVWTGLAVVLLPIAIHLFGQGRARRQKFPTLRFFGTPRPLPIQRTRIHDLLLLLVRIGVLVAAVAALAEPRRERAGTAPTRTASVGIVVDNSASMIRRTAGNEPVINVAQRMAQMFFDSAQRHVVVLAASPAHAIPGVLAWLARQSGLRTLVVISDFQSGTLDRRDLAALPSDIGIRLVPVPVTVTTEGIITHSNQGDADVNASIRLTPDSTSVEWRVTTASHAMGSNTLVALAGDDEAAGAAAAAIAARTMAVPLPMDTTRALAIVYPHASDRASLQRRMSPLHTRWMVDLVARLPHDSLLLGEAAVAGRERMILMPLTAASSIRSAELIVAATRALSVAPSVAELDPGRISDSTLTSWQRPPRESAPRVSSSDDRSDGRWLWLVALLLLGSETLLRRAPRNPASAVTNDATS